MTAFPPELLTLFASSMTGGFIKLCGRSIEHKRQERLCTLQALNYKAQLLQQARHYNNPGYQWTRRIIALLAVFFVIVFPKIVSVLYPHIPVTIGYPQLQSGFLFFTTGVEKINWMKLQGLVITPLDTHLVSAIVGLYFGGSLIKT
jgi:predicted transporter